MKVILSGNEAVARGFYEGGGRFASAYPGTPSTEVLENIARFKDVIAQWAPNEKVAVEVVVGASLGGARALAAMKHVGLNVAADPLFSLSYMGVNGGVVIMTADDPGMHSSQNEQDNRWYAKAAKIPMLEPSDSQEAKDFTIQAFEISESFDTPVLLRTTTRVSHSKGVVSIGERMEVPLKPYRKELLKNVLLPSTGRVRHPVVENRLKKLRAFATVSGLNWVDWGERKMGIITSGAAYQYSREVFPDASYLKLGMSYPLPEKLIKDFSARVEKLYVIEELDDFLELHIRAMGINVTGKEKIPAIGELTPDVVSRALLEREAPEFPSPEVKLPARPPVLCPGCSHRGVFWALKKLRAIVTGDIGCYTLAALPPLEAMDTCLNMGASVGMAEGMVKVSPEKFQKKVVGIIGDSTFIHSGITGLVDMVYNKAITTVIILDNRITAMTGHQENPASGLTLKKEPTEPLDLEKLCRAIGIRRVRKMDPYKLREMTEIIREEMRAEEPSVLIADAPCVLHEKSQLGPAYYVDQEKCVACDLCYKIGCPAIMPGPDGKKPIIDPLLCIGCDQCAQVCQLDAILPMEREQ
jgi:indolepyruvate ferredoxin oxidoreductase alpha subunit